jgi:hypothetical protein
MLPELFRVRHRMDAKQVFFFGFPIKFLAPQMPCRELKLSGLRRAVQVPCRQKTLLFDLL